MTDREYQIHSYASWMLSTITIIEILKSQNAAGHAQQLTYVLNKFFNLTAEKFGDEFRDEFHAMFEKLHGPTSPNSNDNDIGEGILH